MRGKIITREEMLAIPAEEISDLSQIPSEPMVSVLVITYNQEAFIEQTIRGILEQQCDFPIELIIGEDKSQDRTLEICLNYQKRYPQIVRIVTWSENVGLNANLLRIWGRARGKYLAYCEGDDYWTDLNKLSKQVDFLEKYPDTILCGSNFQFYPARKELQNIKSQYSVEELIFGEYFHTSTYMFRTSQFQVPECAFNASGWDTVLAVAAALQGKVRCIPDTTSVYRIHEIGLYSGLNNERQIHWYLSIVQDLLTFVDESYVPMVRKRENRVNSWLCHELASNGQLKRARAIAWKTVWRLSRRDPKQALVLLFHMCLPRTYQAVFEAWTRRKQSNGLIHQRLTH